MNYIMPPILEAAYPAFIAPELGETKEIEIPYIPSVYNNVSVFTIEYKFSELSSSTILGTDTIDKKESDDNTIIISYNWQPNTYYKIQVRLKVKEEYSDWSNIMVLKAIEKPEIFIVGLGENNLTEPNGFYYFTSPNSKFTGQYQCEGTEAVEFFRFRLFANDELKEDSDWLTHNSQKDGIDNGKIISTDTYSFKEIMTRGVNYKIEYSIKTENLYEASIVAVTRYITNVDKTSGVTIAAEADEENGRVKIELDFGSVEKANLDYKILRACSKNNFSIWEEIADFKQLTNKFEFNDYLIESGYTYKYGIQEGDKYPIWTPEIDVYFDHIYLYAKGKQLKLNLNPQMSTFKHTRLVAKQDTIGGRYPIIFRNGQVNYAEFPINALISLQSDRDNCFTDLSSIDTNLTNYNIAMERKYREEVEAFLNNGQPKLFKSPTEGNFIVGLMNISFSPNATLGRMIANMSAQAYEIAEYSLANLKQLNIYDGHVKFDQEFFGQKILKQDGIKMLELPNNCYFTRLEFYNVSANDGAEIDDKTVPASGILIYTAEELSQYKNTVELTSGEVYDNYKFKYKNEPKAETTATLKKAKIQFGSSQKNNWSWIKGTNGLELTNVQIIFSPEAKKKIITLDGNIFDYSNNSNIYVYQYSSVDYDINSIEINTDIAPTIYYVEVVSAE